ncbi:MAG: PTS sugar transporter subunit IIA [Alcaligenaceae bacterium]|nr:PTS sugar transporter subunit IIA [Alcaligenaceae bacterium]
MLEQVLTADMIALDVEAADWREAIRKSGELLCRGGKVTEEYIDDMIRMVEELGPYIVIIPGIALAHARPDTKKVKELGLSLVRLKEPLPFGHEKNDPVKIVLGFATKDKDSHLVLLQEVTYLLKDGRSRELLFSGNQTDLLEAIKQLDVVD